MEKFEWKTIVPPDNKGEIIEFKNNMISIIAHKTTMDIPIINTLYNDKKNSNFKNRRINKFIKCITLDI